MQNSHLKSFLLGSAGLLLLGVAACSDSGDTTPADNGASDAAEDAADATENAVDDAADAASDAVDDAADATEEAAEDAADTVEDAAEDAMDTAEDAAEDVEDTAEDAMDDAEEAVDEATEPDSNESAASTGSDTANTAGGTSATPAAATANSGGAVTVNVGGLTGTADAGEAVFRQCMACHVVQEGVNRVGPSLYGIVGRTAGTVEGYNYTPANKESGVEWTPENLFEYLEDPRAYIPGTKMAFVGIPDPQKRADLIAYLKANSPE